MLNENIQALRKAKGLSQEELANQVHVVRQTVSKWENGLSVPDAEMLIRIAKALDCSVHILLGEKLPEPEQEESVAEIANKLELLNEDFARCREKRRKLWRNLFLALGILSLPGIVQGILSFLHSYQAKHMLEADTAIIGGADTATSILVSSLSASEFFFLLALLAFAVALFGLYRTRRKYFREDAF